ncbi:MAG: dTDP-4-dehydrorhamnose 3,5-epimerase [Bacteriovoracia bacterium]
MNAKTTPIEGLLLVEPRVFRDDRGFFSERFREDKLAEIGIHEKFVQDNHSRSAPRVLRGLHFQTNPKQGKLVSVVRGRIWDVAVDLRKGSSTYGKYFGVELNDTLCNSLWVPYGFAHGFCVLGDEPADVFYKVTGVYNALAEGGLRWDDPQVAVQWPIENPLISPRDSALPGFRQTAPLT